MTLVYRWSSHEEKRGRNINLDAQASQLSPSQIAEFWSHIDKRGSDNPDDWAWVGEGYEGRAVFSTTAKVEGVEEQIGFDARDLALWLLEHESKP
jgi:hypothetical protein